MQRKILMRFLKFYFAHDFRKEDAEDLIDQFFESYPEQERHS